MAMTPEKIQLIRETQYEPFRAQMDHLEEIISSDHDNWWFRTMLFLGRLQRAAVTTPEQFPEGMLQFVEQMVQQVQSRLADEVGAEGDPVVRAHEVVLDISDRMPSVETREHEAVTVMTKPLEELVAEHPQLEFSTWEKNGQTRRALTIFDTKGAGHCFPLPDEDTLFHKGGFPRVLLKLMVGADPALIDAELPPNDFDIIALKTTKNIEEKAAVLSVDPDGIEYVSQLQLDRLFLERDIDLNMAVVGTDAFYFSEQALAAAKSGKIRVMSAHRGIYGTEFFYYDGQPLLKNRGLMRLLKTVADGKATHFDFTPLNEQISFGIYWLVLFRKYLSKDDGAAHLDRLYFLAQKTQQLPEGAQNIIEVIDVIHAKYSFFDFNQGALDEVGVTRWLGKKLIRQVDMTYRHMNTIPNEMTMDRSEGDTIPYTVSLDGYVPDPERVAWIQSQLSPLLARCRRRTRAYKEVASESFEDTDD